MATCLIDCEGNVIREVPFDADLPALCRQEEELRNDGRAVIASRDGWLEADATGYWDRDEGPPPYDAATATGMYDRD